MTHSIWRIGQLLNAVQSGFVGLLRVWSIPIVLMLSIASGFTTYYGMSFFITWWIALIITVAVQSIVVICTLELASIHWRANLPRFLSIAASLLVALAVSVSFSYFKFYEFSQRDNILIERHNRLERDISRYLDDVAGLKSELMARQRQKIELVEQEASQAFLGIHPAMGREYRNQVGKGRFWSHYNDIRLQEQSRLDKLEQDQAELERRQQQLRAGLQAFSFHMNDPAIYEKLLLAVQGVRTQADSLAAGHGLAPVKGPQLMSFAEFERGATPSFAMWKNVSWFALISAAMVDFFTVILTYRLESTAPGPLTEEEKELAYQGLRQFGDFTINVNDELQFHIEKTELERARRVSDWTRMFAVAFLLNRGYLRKISATSVEFAPNLYPVIAERMQLQLDKTVAAPIPANDGRLHDLLEKRRHA